MLKPKYRQIYGQVALTLGSVSQCQRLKVGALILEINNGVPCIVSDGVNGLRSGEGNCCEDNEGRTLVDVRHAEDAAISKLYAKAGLDSVKGKILVVSDSPCPDCAEKIVTSGITHVYYVRSYRKTEGLDILRAAGLVVEKIQGPIDPPLPMARLHDAPMPRKPKGWHESLRTTLESLNKRLGK